jgi:galactonate dehydratase
VKITDIRCFVMGTENRNWIFVRVDTDEGIHGWGEATAEWQEGAVVENIKNMAPILVGRDPTRIQQTWQLLFRHHWWRLGMTGMSALSGIDQALWDVTGKAFNQPVYRLLGGACRDRIRLYARGDRHLDSEVEEAVAAREEGFTAFKSSVKSGVLDEREQVATLVRNCRAIRDRVGDTFDLMLDLQGVFTLRGVQSLCRELSELNVLWIEEPLPDLDLDGMARLVALNPGPAVAMGERLLTRWAFKPVLEARAADIIQPDVCHTGGISEMQRVAAYAEAFNIPVAPHNPLGPVALAASVQIAAAMPNFLVLEYCRASTLFEGVQVDGIRIKCGHAELPDRAGLGVELDQKVIERYPYRSMPHRLWFAPDGSTPLI